MVSDVRMSFVRLAHASHRTLPAFNQLTEPESSGRAAAKHNDIEVVNDAPLSITTINNPKYRGNIE